MWTALTLLLVAGQAEATVPDKYGHGGRMLGSGGGGVAMVEDGYSALLNPAGLGRIRRPTAAVGISAAVEHFKEVPPLWWDMNRDGTVDDRDPILDYSVGVDDAVGFHLATGRQVGGKFGLGACMYMPAGRLLRFSTFEPELPTYFMHVNRPQRYVFAAGVGGEIVKGVSIGAAVDVLSSARLTVVMTIDAEVTAEDAEGGEVEDLIGDVVFDIHELHLDLVPGLVPVFGIQLEVGDWVPALDGLVLGAAYRGKTGLIITGDVDLQANVAAEDIGDLEPFLFALVGDIDLLMYDHYVPPTLTVGVAWRTDDTLSAYFDARHTWWRDMTMNITRVTQVDITSPMVEIDEFITDGNDHDVTLGNVWSFRLGTELRLPQWDLDSKLRYLRLTFRGGFGYDPSPLVGQADSSALIDPDRTMFTLGTGLEVWDPFDLVDGAVRLDGFFQYHVLASGTLARASEVPTPGYPRTGTDIPFGGNIYVVGAELSFDY